MKTSNYIQNQKSIHYNTQITIEVLIYKLRLIISLYFITVQCTIYFVDIYLNY